MISQEKKNLWDLIHQKGKEKRRKGKDEKQGGRQQKIVEYSVYVGG